MFVERPEWKEPRYETPSPTAVKPETPTQYQPQPTPQPAQQTAPQPTKEQQEFLNALNDLMSAINELSFTSPLLSQELLKEHPELEDLRNAIDRVIKSAWKFVKLVRRART